MSHPKPKLEKQLDIDGALELILDPISGSKAHKKEVEGIVSIHVDDGFMTGGDYFKKQVIARLRNDFKVGSEDPTDVAFVGQRVKWIHKDGKRSHIRVDQEVKVEELSEIVLDKYSSDEMTVTSCLHAQFRTAGTDKLATVQDTIPVMLPLQS